MQSNGKPPPPPLRMKWLRSMSMWLVWNVPLGRFAPNVMGFALGSKPQKRK